MSYTFSQFSTLGGAVVKVTTNDAGTQEWLCLGCRASSHHAQTEHAIRTEANAHAGQCRSMPLTTS